MTGYATMIGIGPAQPQQVNNSGDGLTTAAMGEQQQQRANNNGEGLTMAAAAGQ